MFQSIFDRFMDILGSIWTKTHWYVPLDVPFQNFDKNTIIIIVTTQIGRSLLFCLKTISENRG